MGLFDPEVERPLAAAQPERDRDRARREGPVLDGEQDLVLARDRGDRRLGALESAFFGQFFFFELFFFGFLALFAGFFGRFVVRFAVVGFFSFVPAFVFFAFVFFVFSQRVGQESRR